MFIRIISFLLLIVLLTETTGVTLVHHFCSMSNTCEIKSIDGFSRESEISCSCEEEMCNASSNPEEQPQSFSAPACCYEVSTFLKFDFSSILHIPFVFTPFTDGFTLLTLVKSVQPAKVKIIPDDPFFRFYSPPLAGLNLLHAIHQIKIPAGSLLACLEGLFYFLIYRIKIRNY
jgi:hypothetical protein